MKRFTSLVFPGDPMERSDPRAPPGGQIGGSSGLTGPWGPLEVCPGAPAGYPGLPALGSPSDLGRPEGSGGLPKNHGS